MGNGINKGVIYEIVQSVIEETLKVSSVKCVLEDENEASLTAAE